MRGIHRWPVNSPHKGTATRKIFPFDDVIMYRLQWLIWILKRSINGYITRALLLFIAEVTSHLTQFSPFLFFFKLSSPKHLCSTLYTKSDVFSFVVLMIYRLQGCTGNMRGCRYGDLYIAWSYASVCTMHRSLKQFTRTFVYCTVMRQNCKVTIYVIFQKEYFNHATLLLHSYFTNQ